MMAELVARSLHDRKVVGSNPAGSNSDQLVSITRIDGYIQPKSEPALELYSRATSSVGVTYRSSGPNTGSNSRGRTQKKIIISTYVLVSNCQGRNLGCSVTSAGTSGFF